MFPKKEKLGRVSELEGFFVKGSQGADFVAGLLCPLPAAGAVPLYDPRWPRALLSLSVV